MAPKLTPFLILTFLWASVGGLVARPSAAPVTQQVVAVPVRKALTPGPKEDERAVPSPVSAAASSTDSAPRMPLLIPDRFTLGDSEMPRPIYPPAQWLTVGRLPVAATGGARDFYDSPGPQPNEGGCFFLKNDTLLQHPLVQGLEKGEIKLLPAQAGSPTVIWLSGPVINTGTEMAPVSLSRQGHVLTLGTDMWDAGFLSLLANIPTKPVFVISLGALEAGDYTLRVEQRVLRQTRITSGLYTGLYRSQGLFSGSLPFHVFGAGPDAAVTQKPATLRYGDLHFTEFACGGVGPLYQPFSALASRLWRKNTSLDGPDCAQPGVRAGAFPSGDWLGTWKEHPDELDLPDLRVPVRGQPIYISVAGPPLNAGEWMSLRDIQWNDKVATLHVELWRDTKARKDNRLFQPLLLVPLQVPTQFLDDNYIPLPAGYNVKVEWTVRVATEPGGLYVETHGPLTAFIPASITNTLEQIP